MQKDPEAPKGHITLKEASRISGYAPDYVGQLIRRGKLYGRQVYFNVAWVTTEEAVREYMARGKGSEDEEGGDSFKDRWRRLRNTLLSEARLTVFFKTVLGAGLIAALGAILFFLYIGAVALDRSLDHTRSFERVEAEALKLPLPDEPSF